MMWFYEILGKHVVIPSKAFVEGSSSFLKNFFRQKILVFLKKMVKSTQSRQLEHESLTYSKLDIFSHKKAIFVKQ